MERVEIEVHRRDSVTTAAAVRRNKRIPGIYYGAGGPNVVVDVDERQFERLGLACGGVHLIRFRSADAALDGGVALVREIQTHPTSGSPIHVDFLRVDVTKSVHASVALAFVGKAVGVVEGGILQPLRREIEVKGLPEKLPETVEVDVASLSIHDSVHVSELVLPEGVTAVYAEDIPLVTVVPPVVEQVEVEEEIEEAGAEAAETPTAEQAKSEESGE